MALTEEIGENWGLKECESPPGTCPGTKTIVQLNVNCACKRLKLEAAHMFRTVMSARTCVQLNL